MDDVPLRDAVEGDLGAILEIHNEVVRTSTAIYSFDPSTLDERRAWWSSRTAAGFPVIVADRAGQVLGYASYGEFRGAWPGYRYSVEHSVYVRSDRQGQGLGSALVRSLLDRAAQAGKHVMLGGIDAANAGSLAMHQKLGFVPVARFPEVGRKFGRWLDLVFLQRFVDAPGWSRHDEDGAKGWAGS